MEIGRVKVDRKYMGWCSNSTRFVKILTTLVELFQRFNNLDSWTAASRHSIPNFLGWKCFLY